MLSVLNKNPDDYIESTEQLVQSNAIEYGISSIEWPPFNNVG